MHSTRNDIRMCSEQNISGPCRLWQRITRLTLSKTAWLQTPAYKHPSNEAKRYTPVRFLERPVRRYKLQHQRQWPAVSIPAQYQKDEVSETASLLRSDNTFTESTFSKSMYREAISRGAGSSEHDGCEGLQLARGYSWRAHKRPLVGTGPSVNNLTESQQSAVTIRLASPYG